MVVVVDPTLPIDLFLLTPNDSDPFRKASQLMPEHLLFIIATTITTATSTTTTTATTTTKP